MNIDMNHKYQTRDGQAVEILRTNVKNAVFPIVGIITHADGSETQDRWKGDGGYDSYRHPLDLVPVLTKHEGWMVFDTGDYCLYKSQKEAESAIAQDALATPSYVAAHVTWED